MLQVCTHMFLVCYSYVTRMLFVCYSCVIRMLFVCYSYVTRMLPYAAYALVCYSMYTCGVLFPSSRVIIQVFSQIPSGPAVLVFNDHRFYVKQRNAIYY